MQIKQEEIIKLAGNDIPGVLREAASHLTKIAAENVALEERATSAETEVRLMKIARRMEERHLDTNLSFEEKVAQLRGYTAQKLASVEAGIEFVTNGASLGTVGDAKTATDGASIDDFILSGAAYGNG